MTVISTTSVRELSEFNTALVQFSRQLPGISEELFLQYPIKWLLGSQYGCSCGFRHLDHGNEEMGFADPVDWWPEEQEDIKATQQVVNIFKVLLGEGAKLDCVDIWTNYEKGDAKLFGKIVVNLSATSDSSFRFFEGYRFEFTSET